MPLLFCAAGRLQNDKWPKEGFWPNTACHMAARRHLAEYCMSYGRKKASGLRQLTILAMRSIMKDNGTASRPYHLQGVLS